MLDITFNDNRTLITKFIDFFYHKPSKQEQKPYLLDSSLTSFLHSNNLNVYINHVNAGKPVLFHQHSLFLKNLIASYQHHPLVDEQFYKLSKDSLPIEDTEYGYFVLCIPYEFQDLNILIKKHTNKRDFLNAIQDTTDINVLNLSYSIDGIVFQNNFLEKIHDAVYSDEGIKFLINTWVNFIENSLNPSYFLDNEYMNLIASFPLIEEELYAKATNQELRKLKKLIKRYLKNKYSNKIEYEFYLTSLEHQEYYGLHEIIKEINQNISIFRKRVNTVDLSNLTNNKLHKLKDVSESNTSPKFMMKKTIYIPKTLPHSSLLILNQISSLYSYLYDNKLDLSLDEQINVDRFINKIIPETIQHYQSLYKDTLSQECDQVISLLNNPLQNVFSYFSQLKNNIEEKKVNHLKAMNTYSHAYLEKNS